MTFVPGCVPLCDADALVVPVCPFFVDVVIFVGVAMAFLAALAFAALAVASVSFVMASAAFLDATTTTFLASSPACCACNSFCFAAFCFEVLDSFNAGATSDLVFSYSMA